MYVYVCPQMRKLFAERNELSKQLYASKQDNTKLEGKVQVSWYMYLNIGTRQACDPEQLLFQVYYSHQQGICMHMYADLDQE